MQNSSCIIEMSASTKHKRQYKDERAIQTYDDNSHMNFCILYHRKTLEYFYVKQ